MKKIFLLLLVVIVNLIIPNYVQATEENISQESIMESQQEMLGISSFIEEADKYTQNVYEDLDMGELFSSAITGNIDNKSIFKSILEAIRRRSI